MHPHRTCSVIWSSVQRYILIFYQFLSLEWRFISHFYAQFGEEYRQSFLPSKINNNTINHKCKEFAPIEPKRDFDICITRVLFLVETKFLFLLNEACQVTKETKVKRNLTNRFLFNAILKALFITLFKFLSAKICW